MMARQRKMKIEARMREEMKNWAGGSLLSDVNSETGCVVRCSSRFDFIVDDPLCERVGSRHAFTAAQRRLAREDAARSTSRRAAVWCELSDEGCSRWLASVFPAICHTILSCSSLVTHSTSSSVRAELVLVLFLCAYHYFRPTAQAAALAVGAMTAATNSPP